MEGIKVTINEKTGDVTITGKIGADGGPFGSSSGKSVLLLNSGGTRVVEGVTYKGRQVSLNLNVTIPHPDAPVKEQGKDKAPKTQVKV